MSVSERRRRETERDRERETERQREREKCAHVLGETRGKKRNKKQETET